MSEGYGQPPDDQYQGVSTSVTATRRSRNPLPFVIGGLVLLLAAGVGGFFLLNRDRVNTPDPHPASNPGHTAYIPADALLYLNYNTQADANTSPNLDRIESVFEANPNWKTLSEKNKQDMKAMMQEEVTRCKDQPAAYLFSDTNDAWRAHTSYAFVAPNPDKLKALNRTDQCFGYALARIGLVFVVNTAIEPEDKATMSGQLFQKTQGSVTLDKAEDYNGETIYKLTHAGLDFFVVMHGQDAVVTMDGDLARRQIDAGRAANQTLDKDADYQATAARLPGNAMFTMYANLNRVRSFYQQLDGSGMGSMVDVSGTLGLSMVAQDNGIQVDVASAIESQYLDFKHKARPLEVRTLLAQAPADILGLCASQDLKGLVNAVQRSSLLSLAGMATGTDTGGFDAAKQQFKTETGLDFDNDVLAWMGGEFFGYGYVNGQDESGYPKTEGAGAIKLTNEGDKQKAQNFVTRITEYARKQAAAEAAAQFSTGSNKPPTDASVPALPATGGSGYAGPDTSRTITVEDEQVNGAPFQSVKIVETTSYDGSNVYTNTTELHYGVTGDAFVVASSKAAAESYGKGNSLTGAPIYQASVKHLDPKNGGMSYTNLEALRLMYEQFSFKDDPDSKKQYEEEIKPYLAPFKGLGLTNTQADDRFTSIRVHFYIDR